MTYMLIWGQKKKNKRKEINYEAKHRVWRTSDTCLYKINFSLREFQLMMSTLNDSSLSSEQNTNRFLV